MGGVDIAQQCDVDRAAVVVDGHVHERAVGRGGGVGDNHIQAAEQLRGSGERRAHRSGVGDVG